MLPVRYERKSRVKSLAVEGSLIDPIGEEDPHGPQDLVLGVLEPTAPATDHLHTDVLQDSQPELVTVSSFDTSALSRY